MKLSFNKTLWYFGGIRSTVQVWNESLGIINSFIDKNTKVSIEKCHIHYVGVHRGKVIRSWVYTVLDLQRITT
jgi:hypothetical protein